MITYFYPRPPRGGRLTSAILIPILGEFLSTPSARRATLQQSCAVCTRREFLSTPSARRATATGSPSLLLITDFYPRPPRGGRLIAPPPLRGVPDISIHALREEGDVRCYHKSTTTNTISIHALREEGDLLARVAHCFAWLFLSTPSARRATPGQTPGMPRPLHFYPRPPRGGRRVAADTPLALLEFLSTPSARRATRHHPARSAFQAISIHALREEGDVREFLDAYADDISIHALREEGDLLCGSCWGVLSISIHALREEGDARSQVHLCGNGAFLSTPSARRATPGCELRSCHDGYFYPRPPRGGRLLQ